MSSKFNELHLMSRGNPGIRIEKMDDISSRRRLVVPQPSGIDTEALHPRTQGRGLEAQELGCAAGASNLTSCVLDCLENVAALDLVEGHHRLVVGGL